MKLIYASLNTKIIDMEKTFYLRLPGDTYYDYPLNKDSVCFAFDLDSKTITQTRRVLKDGGFATKTKEFSISKEWLSIIEKTLEGQEEFLTKYLSKYVPADGQRFVHSVFSFGNEKIIFPDYLTNFGNNDIFKRYRYYPEEDRVKLYAIIRSLTFIAFKVTMHYHKDFPTSNKINYMIKTHGERLSLE